MTTCRDVLAEALRSFKALAPGDDPTVDELNSGLVAIQNLLLDLHEARGPLIEVDVSADYTAGENQRVRVQNGYTVTITLPNSVQDFGLPAPYDYGFRPSTDYPLGSANAADGITTRPPADGSRIEVVGQAVGTVPGLYFFRADTDDWILASGLSIDSTLPLNGRYVSHLGALVAERLIETWPGGYEPTPGLMKRIARANSTLLVRPGNTRQPVTASYF